jgi:tetratricopeptide (TPR) repeat protein
MFMKRYRAFLSYSHNDTRAAKRLHRALEHFHIDSDLVGNETPVGPVPKTLRPVFRDREDFSAGGSLGDQTEEVLASSPFLIVVCSPSAAASHYVNEEIRKFKTLGRGDRIIPVIVHGAPGDPERECFPPALRFKVDDNGAVTDQPDEILAADLREIGDGRELAVAKVAARLMGLGTDDVFRRAERARRRRGRVRTAIIATVTALVIMASASGVYAWQQLQTNEAFLLATLKRAGGMVQAAVVQSTRFGIPRSVTLQLLGQAEGLFDDMARLGRETPEIQRQRAWMMIQYARSYAVLGRTDKRGAYVANAERIMRRLTQVRLADPVSQRGLTTAFDERGDLLVAEGNLAQARKSYQASLTIRARLAASGPKNAAWHRDLSVSHEKLGTVQAAQGDLDGALASFQAAVIIIKRLVAAFPDNKDEQRDLSVSHNKVGDVQRLQGDLRQALRSYQAGLIIARKLAAADSANADWQRDLAVSYERVGVVLVPQGKLARALESFRTSLQIRKRLAATDPRNARWQRDMSVSQDRIGDVLRTQGHPGQTLMAYQASLEIRKRLAASDPENRTRRRDLSVSHNKIGDLARAQGDLFSALGSYRAGLVLIKDLTMSDPTNARWRRDLSVSHDRVGDVLRAQKELGPALNSYKAALSERQELVALDPNNAVGRRDLSVSHNKIAAVLRAQGDFQQALDSYRAGLVIAVRLAASDARNTRWQRDLSFTHERIGDVLIDLKQVSRALLSYRAGLVIRTRLAAVDPGNAVWQRDLAWSHWGLAKHGDRPRFRWGQVVAILKALDRKGRLAASDRKWIPVAEKNLIRASAQ